MEGSTIDLRHTPGQRAASALAGAAGLAAGCLVLFGTLSAALGEPVTVLGVVILALAALAGHRLLTWGWRQIESSAARPGLIIHPDALLVDDQRLFDCVQAIPAELVARVHVGPEVAGWLVGVYGRSRDEGRPETQLSRFPQLPNVLIELHRPIRFQAARRLIPLWHLAHPPTSRRTVGSVWATVEDPDAAYLAFAAWSPECAWATSGDEERPARGEAA